MGCGTRSPSRGFLQNPTFKGTTYFGRTKRIALGGNRRRVEERPPEEWIEIPGATPAIVAESLFDIVQAALSKPKTNPNVSSRKYLLTSHIECDCGAPVVGTCLNQTYRYYRCRSTWPTSTRPRTCDASYIKADLLEQEVWKAVTEVLEQPEVVAEELESQQGGLQLLEEEMARVNASIRRLADQKKRLIRLYGIGHVTEDYLSREAGLVRKAREDQEAALSQLSQRREHIGSLDGLGDRVKAFCAKVADRLHKFDFDEKRLALQALQGRVVVGQNSARLQGAIPTNLATIEQTSA